MELIRGEQILGSKEGRIINFHKPEENKRAISNIAKLGHNFKEDSSGYSNSAMLRVGGRKFSAYTKDGNLSVRPYGHDDDNATLGLIRHLTK